MDSLSRTVQIGRLRADKLKRWCAKPVLRHFVTNTLTITNILTYVLGYVQTIQDSFCAATKKKIPDRASVLTNKHGCGSAKLRRADLLLVERHTSDKDTGYCFVPYSGAV